MRSNKIIALFMVLVFLFVLGACSGTESSNSGGEQGGRSEGSEGSGTEAEKPAGDENKPDTVVVWTYPVHQKYADDLPELIADFNAMYPHIKVEYEILSWEEGPKKFDIALNSGNPPDLYYHAVSGHYVNTGLAVQLDRFLTAEIKDDYYLGILELGQIQGKQYGLPLTQSMWNWGGNRRILEDGGVDWQRIQKEGWTWSEFLEIAKKLTKKLPDGTMQYGLVTDGTSNDFSTMLAQNAGLVDVVDENGNFLWNDERILDVLIFVDTLMKEGIMPPETAALTPQQRTQMFYDSQTAILSKGLPYYDTIIKNRNKDIDTGKITGEKIEFILLPIPHHDKYEAKTAVFGEGYVMFTQKNVVDKPENEQHLQNVFLVMEALTGAKGGNSSNELNLPFVRKSQEEFYAGKENASPYNQEAAKIMAQKRNVVVENLVDVEVGTKMKQFKEQVQKPGFQALFAQERTPEQIFEEFKTKGVQIFGK